MNSKNIKMSGYSICNNCSKETWYEVLDDSIVQTYIENNLRIRNKIITGKVNTINLGYINCPNGNCLQ